jgi:hypothetical protein
MGASATSSLIGRVNCLANATTFIDANSNTLIYADTVADSDVTSNATTDTNDRSFESMVLTFFFKCVLSS